MERGRIVKALSGFYYVDSGNGTLTQCRARGRFRKERMSPLVGDWVRFSGSGAQGMVEEIEPRRNSFIRPAVSNLDALVVLASGANPVTDPFLIDRVAAIAGNQNVPVVLCVNKTDLESGESLTHIYRHAGSFRRARPAARALPPCTRPCAARPSPSRAILASARAAS